MKSITATLKLLEEKSQNTGIGAIDLFYFLGCFSSGVSYECLQSIWPGSQLEDSVYLFEKLGLL